MRCRSRAESSVTMFSKSCGHITYCRSDKGVALARGEGGSDLSMVMCQMRRIARTLTTVLTLVQDEPEIVSSLQKLLLLQ